MYALAPSPGGAGVGTGGTVPVKKWSPHSEHVASLKTIPDGSPNAPVATLNARSCGRPGRHHQDLSFRCAERACRRSHGLRPRLDRAAAAGKRLTPMNSNPFLASLP